MKPHNLKSFLTKTVDVPCGRLLPPLMYIFGTGNIAWGILDYRDGEHPAIYMSRIAIGAVVDLTAYSMSRTIAKYDDWRREKFRQLIEEGQSLIRRFRELTEPNPLVEYRLPSDQPPPTYGQN